jgi:hypothetical protein
MSNEPKLPDFNQFSRWLASRLNDQAVGSDQFAQLHTAARDARDEFVRTQWEGTGANSAVAADRGSLEVLQLLAAADRDASLPPEITTPRGFRITLAFDEGSGAEPASIGVLVVCPPDLLTGVEGKTVYLWSGSERFELGQFDAEGKAIGTLPAGIEITASDFAAGKVKLEAPEAE